MKSNDGGKSLRNLLGASIAVGFILVGAFFVYSLGFGQKAPSSVHSTTMVMGFTVADELKDLGENTWEVELYFPTMGLATIIDAVTRSSCPEHVQGTPASNGTTVTILTQNMEIVSSPASGKEKVTVGPGYKTNNCMPGVLPGDIYEHWQNTSVFRFSGLSTPFASSDIEAYVSYGPATLVRDGTTYPGYGTYAHYTSSTMSDPRPGFYFQFGWTPTPGYVLFVAKTLSQDLSAIVTSNGEIIRTPVDISTAPGCHSFTYEFHLSGTRMSLTYSITRFLVGTASACSGENFGTFSDNVGHTGVMWSIVDR